jgi:pimeloyl-ACP methyl ester carboxylesterase
LADDLAEIITHFGGKAHILGQSMGGKAAMVLVLTQPDLLAKLVVVDIAPVAYAHSHAANIDAMRSVDLTKVTRRADADTQLARRVSDAGLRAFFLQSLAITPEGAAWRLNLDALESNDQQITGFPAMTSQFGGPTLFLKGALSDYINATNESQIQVLFPSARTTTIEEAGHWLQADKPAELVHALTNFLAE